MVVMVCGQSATAPALDWPSKHLRILAVAFPRECGSVQQLIEANPAEWEETITTGIRDDLAELVKMLGGRASSGLRLQRLEWRVAEWDDYFQLEFLPTAVLSTYVPPPTALYDQTKLETLVDGPVVFGGVTYQVSLA
ncbi:uncharacterized protein BXZ73DRAFT_106272 [Epithele typhae]|uniref:uncharacterized protein n=1 Tax=Epithele typhae TaxID=378194 RepID=UPI0020089038|nr:uncharacterized protein BXZ73DRAFT_106272 [Epithele typhae]KAH9915301.1 hypothetical protein BXZ73DRAFT_106272 [Epithele typhae]